MKYTVVIVAAGSGSRMKLGYNKVYYRLKGETILEKSISTFDDDKDCEKIVVVTDVETFHKEIKKDYDKVVVVEGGATRQDSVNNGLAMVETEYVMIHDGARPFLSFECIENIKHELETSEAVCLMVPVKNTIKQVRDGVVVQTLKREELMAAQTPQAFKTDLLISCIYKAREDNFVGTDDCSLVEKYSDTKVTVVLGDYENIKITTPEDIS